MGYSFEDFFDNVLKPKLVELLNHDFDNEIGCGEKFLNIIKSSLDDVSNSKFRATFLSNVLGENVEHLAPYEFLQECLLSSFHDDVELLYIGYKVGNKTVHVSYVDESEKGNE